MAFMKGTNVITHDSRKIQRRNMALAEVPMHRIRNFICVLLPTLAKSVPLMRN